VPELPEVETVRRTLLPRILGSKVLTARLLRRDVLIAPGDPSGGFSRQRSGSSAPPAAITPSDMLEGCTITEILRRGKQLAIIGQPARGEPQALIVQLGMSGQLFIEPGAASGSPLPTHVHAVWTFHDALQEPNPKRTKDTAQLCFRDPRRFGGLRVLRSLEELNTHWLQLGPDALDLSAKDLLNASRDSTRAIKALLMDQATVAGIGNIYADEALFRAGVRPSRPARRLKPAEAVVLSESIRTILRDAIQARGSTLRDYRDADGRQGDYQGRHAVYGRSGLACQQCGRKLRSAILAQRTTVWCSTCQR
jgi:formamidopyrimidine-DNA glycosylase